MTFEGVVILAGKRVAKAFGIEAPYFEWMVFDRARIAVIPHPSGYSRFWNYAENREVASKFLRTVFA